VPPPRSGPPSRPPPVNVRPKAAAAAADVSYPPDSYHPSSTASGAPHASPQSYPALTALNQSEYICEPLVTEAEAMDEAPWLKQEDREGSYSASRTSNVFAERSPTNDGLIIVSQSGATSASVAASPKRPAQPPPYPYWMSLNLPSGWIRLTYQNIPFFVDVIHQRTSWNDPRSYDDRMMLIEQTVAAGEDVLLRIEVLEGEGLAAKSSDASDPYCYVVQHFRNGLPKKGKLKTKTKKHTIYPRWGPEDRNVLTMSINNQNNVLLFIFDANVVLRDDPLGVINLNLSSLPWCQPVEDWHTVIQAGVNSYVSGRLRLGVTLYPATSSLDSMPPTLCIDAVAGNRDPWFLPTKKRVRELEKSVAVLTKKLEKARVEEQKSSGDLSASQDAASEARETESRLEVASRRLRSLSSSSLTLTPKKPTRVPSSGHLPRYL